MQEFKEKTIDLRDYLRIMLKRRWVIITVFAVVVLFAAIKTFTATPIYQATAQIVIEKENPNLVSIEEVMAVDSTGTDYYQTQYKIIQSRSVAREVIQRLDLPNSPEFFPPPKDNIFATIKIGIKDALINTKNWMVSLLKTEDKADGFAERLDGETYFDSKLVSELSNGFKWPPSKTAGWWT
jgi:uncharacterized protein involved in exopolysaccharide biosynthesis